MKIISKQKDYYDSFGFQFGVDPNIIYVRDPQTYYVSDFKKDPSDLKYKPVVRINGKEALEEERQRYYFIKEVLEQILKIEVPSNIPSHKPGYLTNEVAIHPKIIGFCGELYPCLEIMDINPNNSNLTQIKHGDDVKTVYSMDKLVSLITSDEFSHKHKINKEYIMECLEKDYNRWGNTLTFKSWDTMIREVNMLNSDIIRDLFLNLEAPCFKLSHISKYSQNNNSITINPILKYDEFQKVKNPMEAYQELSMFMGTLMVSQQDPIPDVSDEDMRDMKGFDKWSFKTHPADSKKPRRRQRN
jgi:hypothetical protein